MGLFENHSNVHIRVLLFEQLDQPAILLVKPAFDLKHDTVTKNEVRGVAPWNHEVVLALLVLPVHPVFAEIVSYLTFNG